MFGIFVPFKQKKFNQTVPLRWKETGSAKALEIPRLQPYTKRSLLEHRSYNSLWNQFNLSMDQQRTRSNADENISIAEMIGN